MKTKQISFLLALSLLFGLTACGTASNPSGAEHSDPVSSPATPAQSASPSASPTAETTLFTDDLGREVELPAEITRIVPSAPLAQIILLAVAPEMFCGLASKVYDSSRGILPDSLYDLPYFGSLYAGAELNVEELALAKPDILIDIGEPQDSGTEDLDALQSQTLIPTVFISATLETMPEAYRKLGKLLGKEERGEELAQFCERVYNRTLSILDQVGDQKVNCLYVLGEEGLNVIAASSYHAELLDLLTNNLAIVDNPLSKGTGNEVTMEQIALWNPDFVIFAPDSIYSTVSSLPAWDSIRAIANGNYVEVPDLPHNWMSMPPSVQRYLALIWLPSVLYPEYCDYDVKAEILEYYKLFYGCTLSDEQYASITANAFLR